MSPRPRPPRPLTPVPPAAPGRSLVPHRPRRLSPAAHSACSRTTVLSGTLCERASANGPPRATGARIRSRASWFV